MTKSRLQGQSGFSLVELLVIVTIIGIIAGLSTIGFDMIYGSQLNAAKAQLLSDLKKLRVDAITVASGCTVHTPAHSYTHSRGFGIRFVSDTTYRIFEFNDADDNYSYNSDHTEAIVNSESIFNNGINVTIDNSGSVTNNIRIYDKHGILRKGDWSTVAGQTYVIRRPRVAQAKCIVINAVIIREGIWNGSTSTCD